MKQAWLYQIKTAVVPARKRSRPQALSMLTPRGAITATGATLQVLAVLASQPNRFWSQRDILATQDEKKGLDWSLRYAREMGWIERTSDARSERYLRYRITTLGMRLFE